MAEYSSRSCFRCSSYSAGELSVSQEYRITTLIRIAALQLFAMMEEHYTADLMPDTLTDYETGGYEPEPSDD